MPKQNPYESPKNSDRPKGSLGRNLGAVALGILAIPATAIAFFATCAGTYDLNDTGPQIMSWILGSLAGLAVGAPMIYFIVRLVRR